MGNTQEKVDYLFSSGKQLAKLLFLVGEVLERSRVASFIIKAYLTSS